VEPINLVGVHNVLALRKGRYRRELPSADQRTVLELVDALHTARSHTSAAS